MNNAAFQAWFAGQLARPGDQFTALDEAADELEALFAAADAIMASDLYAE